MPRSIAFRIIAAGFAIAASATTLASPVYAAPSASSMVGAGR